MITAIVLLCMDVRAANCDAAIKKGNGECVDRTPKNQTYTRQPDVKMYGQIEMKVKWTEVKDTYTRTLQNDKGGSELKEFPVGEGASIVLTCTETVETAPVFSIQWGVPELPGATVAYGGGTSTTTEVATSLIPSLDCMKYTVGFQVFTGKRVEKWNVIKVDEAGNSSVIDTGSKTATFKAGKEPYWKRVVVLPSS